MTGILGGTIGSYFANITDKYIAVTHNLNSPYITAYPWSSSGFGTKYANPSSAAIGALSVDFNPDASKIAMGLATGAFVTAYNWSASGFGTKYSNPSTLPTAGVPDIEFSSSGNYVALAVAATPWIIIYPWSNGFGTKYANPATLPPSFGQGASFNSSENSIAIAHSGSPYVTAYPWSSSGFGTKYANPATLPAGTGQDVSFSPSGNAIAVAHATSPFITAYPWSNGFGTKYANPADLPFSTANGIAFSHSGDAVSVAYNNGTIFYAYAWSNGFGTRYWPGLGLNNNGSSTAFSVSDTAIAVTADLDRLTVFPWSGSSFGTKYADPATLPAGAADDVKFA